MGPDFKRCLLPAIVLLSALAAVAQQPPAAFDEQAARGNIVNVTCLEDPAQSYALYLPSHYSRDRTWPVMYIFDPFARGKTAVEIYRAAAEKYGYILVGSNNSKNGPVATQLAAAQADWLDSHRRFAIDKDRVYTTGLSGGARVATSFALYCYTCGVTGVISVGAGYPTIQGVKSQGNDHFFYYGIVGDRDLNYPELVTLEKKKEESGAPAYLKIYPGPHQWPPPEIVDEAFAWLEIKTMQANKERVDRAFVDAQFDKTKNEAAQAGQGGDVLIQYAALRSLAEDFKGLEDVSPYSTQLAQLKSSKAFKNARKNQEREIDEQTSLVATPSSELAQFGADADAQNNLGRHISSVMSDLRRRAASNSSDHLVCARAFSQLLIQGMEAGQEAFRENRLNQATAYFELMAEGAPDQAWPHLALAEVHARAGNKKAAIKALELAVQRGLRAQTLAQDPELQSLAGDPAFQRLTQEGKQ